MTISSHNNTNKSSHSIIDFIEETEVQEYAEDLKNRKRILTAFAIAGAVTLIGVSAYIFPDFLSNNHKTQMQYSASLNISAHNNITNAKKIRDNLHGAGIDK